MINYLIFNLDNTSLHIHALILLEDIRMKSLKHVVKMYLSA